MEIGWILIKVFLLLNLSFTVGVTAQDCCPPNSYLVERSKICSDNTSFDLRCSHGALLLDPAVNENDKFTLELSGSLSFFDGQTRTPDKFCLGKIQRNGSENSELSVALVCFDEEWAQPKISIILRLLMLLSTLFLVVTLYVYVALPNLRDVQGKCVIAFICCLIASYVTLLVIQTFPNSSQVACVIQAASLYFAMSATFFWNNIITFNIWRAIRNASLRIKDKPHMVIYMLWGFGVPLGMVALSFILEHIPSGNHIRPQFGETKCWFRGKLESWIFFYGPVSVLLLLNTVMFLQSTWTLRKTYKMSKILNLKSLKFKQIMFGKNMFIWANFSRYMMYLKLFLLMGISWIFEVLSYATREFEGTKYLWFVTDCVNSAQGILIFLLLVVFRKKVKLGMVKAKLLNINWPQSWATGENQESSTASLKEEVEMRNQKSNLLM